MGSASCIHISMTFENSLDFDSCEAFHYLESRARDDYFMYYLSKLLGSRSSETVSKTELRCWTIFTSITFLLHAEFLHFCGPGSGTTFSSCFVNFVVCVQKLAGRYCYKT
jgi:hypothetical protein